MCLFLCQHHTVLIIVALGYSLKSGSMITSGLFFFLNIALAIQNLYQDRFSNISCLLHVSVSSFGNSCSISIFSCSFFLAIQRGMRDLTSPMRDQTCAPYSGSVES